MGRAATLLGRLGAHTGPPARPGRTIMMSSGWVLAAVLFGLFGTRGAEESQPGHTQLGVLGYVLAVLTPALLVLAWVRPRAVFVAIGLLVLVYQGRYYPGGPTYLWLMAAAGILGLREPIRRSLPLVLADAVLMAAAGSLNLDGLIAILAVLVVIAWALVPVVPWTFAAMVRMNHDSREQAAAERRRQHADEERIRIAREVHDVVGHSLAVISMQAGVALHVADRRPDQARIALEAIARSSRDALSELRGTLAVFRGERDDRSPAPGIDDLPALVAGFTATGQSVQLAITGRERPVPATHDLAAYRIVQESLTNAARHAGAVPAQVVVTRGPEALCVEVCNDAQSRRPVAATSNGSGLDGMRERCTALGGTLHAGPQAGGGWAVHAVLPWRVDER